MLNNLDMMTDRDLYEAWKTISMRNERIRMMVLSGRMDRAEYDANLEKIDAVEREWERRGKPLPPSPAPATL